MWPLRLLVACALVGSALLVGARWAEDHGVQPGDWTALQLVQVEPTPGEQSAQDVIRLIGPAAHPRIRVLFDNPCGHVPGFDYRVARAGVLELRATGTMATANTQPCPAVVVLQAWSVDLPRLSRGVWSIHLVAPSWGRAATPIDLR